MEALFLKHLMLFKNLQWKVITIYFKKINQKLRKFQLFLVTVRAAYRQSHLYSEWKGQALQISEILLWTDLLRICDVGSSVMEPNEKHRKRGWSDGSGVKSTCCSHRGWGLDSQHPHVASQLSRGSYTLFWPLQALYPCGEHAYIKAKYSYNQIK